MSQELIDKAGLSIGQKVWFIYFDLRGFAKPAEGGVIDIKDNWPDFVWLDTKFGTKMIERQYCMSFEDATDWCMQILNNRKRELLDSLDRINKRQKAILKLKGKKDGIVY